MAQNANIGKSLDTSPPQLSTITEKKKEFNRILKHYLEANPLIKTNGKTSELEIRFGTNTKSTRPISKINYDNVVKQLLACGFQCENLSGIHLLRIINSDFLDKKTGRMKDSNIRAEIVGTDMIQEYCRTNSIQKLLDMPSTTHNKIKFTQKEVFRTAEGEYVNKLDMDDFNFRVSLQTEKDYHTQSELVRGIISKWNDSKKKFRCMNRVRFTHPDYPIFADLSIVKMSKRSNRTMMPYYTIQEAGVFNGIEYFEIELEVDNQRVGIATPFANVPALMDAIRKCIRIVLSGLQNTKFPVSYPEQDNILMHYMRLLHGNDYQIHTRIKTKDFIGPSSFTMQIENILPIHEDESKNSKQINIRKGYTVTDKADGERTLLYIHDDGKIYLIDTNMCVLFTGAKTLEKSIFSSLLDGEHIEHDKNGNAIHLFAAFDIYYINKKSLREYAFYPPSEVVEPESSTPKPKYRCELLQTFISLLKPVSVVEPKEKPEVPLPSKSTEFRVQCKQFYNTSENYSIFDGCSKILSNITDGLFEYNTDGLIFTPADLAVGATHAGAHPCPLHKSTWEHSFKWKPAEFNTIDFLVSIKRDKTGKQEIRNEFQEGRNLQGVQEIEQYKTLILLCGFDEKTGYVNPFQDVLDDIIPKPFGYQDENESRNTYKAVPFQPTEPYDQNACFCKIKLKEVGTKMLMMTEAEEVFDEDMIVEFKYDPLRKEGMKWIPLRVRYDKTAELNAGGRNYGNAYHVANSNWRSIHYPITETMISTGKDIPEYAGIEDVYYSRTLTGATEESSTEALRNFHNLFVKKNLILGVAQRGDTLIDYAVGKAGDLSKWTRAHLKFVLGIDISKDNIHNKKDGACARYLKERYVNTNAPNALFITGDSKLNIRTGKAFHTEKEKLVANAVFGIGPKDKSLLGKNAYQNYGIAESGFQVSSCQFALHYFFENKQTFHGFMRNIAECTHLNGYFIGTCYDGKTVFNLLKNKNREEGFVIMKNQQKMFEILKMYDQTGFPDDELCLGYAINIFQESINQVFREYLVNYDFLVRIMEDYGFRPITREEAQQLNLPDATGMFSELFNIMQNEIKMNPARAADYRKSPFMSPEEKRISFMNRYFVFKKILAVNVKKVSDILLREENLNITYDIEETHETMTEMENLVKDIETATTTTNPPQPQQNIKRKRKLVLKNFVPIPENSPPEPELVNITTADVIPSTFTPTMKIKIKRPKKINPT
jgi:hypothetical protein